MSVLQLDAGEELLRKRYKSSVYAGETQLGVVIYCCYQECLWMIFMLHTPLQLQNDLALYCCY